MISALGIGLYFTTQYQRQSGASRSRSSSFYAAQVFRAQVIHADDARRCRHETWSIYSPRGQRERTLSDVVSIQLLLSFPLRTPFGVDRTHFICSLKRLVLLVSHIKPVMDDLACGKLRAAHLDWERGKTVEFLFTLVLKDQHHCTAVLENVSNTTLAVLQSLLAPPTAPQSSRLCKRPLEHDKKVANKFPNPQMTTEPSVGCSRSTVWNCFSDTLRSAGTTEFQVGL